MVAKTDVTETTDKAKRKTVATTVSPEMFERIEDYRWPNRMKVADVLSAALEEYFAKR